MLRGLRLPRGGPAAPGLRVPAAPPPLFLHSLPWRGGCPGFPLSSRPRPPRTTAPPDLDPPPSPPTFAGAAAALRQEPSYTGAGWIAAPARFHAAFGLLMARSHRPAWRRRKKKSKKKKKASKPKNTGKRTALSGRAARGAAAAAVPAEPGAHLRGRSGAAPALPLCNGAAAGGAPAARGAAGGRGSAASEPRGWRAELPRRKFAAAPIGYRGFKRLNLFLFPPKFTTVFFSLPAIPSA